MAQTQYGRAVIYGSTNSLVLAGVAIVSAVQSGSLGVGSNVKKFMDSTGKVCTIMSPENYRELEFEIQPGGAGVTTTASAAAQLALPGAPSVLVTTSFTAADYNGTFIVESASTKFSNEAPMTISVKAFTGDNIATLAVLGT